MECSSIYDLWNYYVYMVYIYVSDLFILTFIVVLLFSHYMLFVFIYPIHARFHYNSQKIKHFSSFSFGCSSLYFCSLGIISSTKLLLFSLKFMNVISQHMIVLDYIIIKMLKLKGCTMDMMRYFSQWFVKIKDSIFFYYESEKSQEKRFIREKQIKDIIADH